MRHEIPNPTKQLLLLSRIASEEEASRLKPRLNVANELFTEIKSLRKSSAEMIPALADQAVGFKACCLKTGKYDGALRNHYVRE